MQRIGPSIQELRLKKRLSLEDTAVFLNISPSLLSLIEKGEAVASKNQIFKLAGFFNIEAQGLLVDYQRDRIGRETKKESLKKNEKSSFIRNKEVAFNRYRNMNHELQQLGKGKLQIKVHKPRYPLNLYIESMTYYSGHNFEGLSEKVMPDGTVQLFIELDDNERTVIVGNERSKKISLKNSWITGIQKQHHTYLLNPGQTTLSIRFYPGGFYALTGIPQVEFANAVIDADLIFDASIARLRNMFLHENELSKIFAKTEQYFTSLIKETDLGHAVISYVCKHIDVPLHSLVLKAGFSQKHLISLFKKHIGVTPKYYQRICRFNQSLSNIQSIQDNIDWAGIVFDNHFFDQAHFIKEFTAFSGVSPQAYLASGSTCTRLIRTFEP